MRMDAGQADRLLPVERAGDGARPDDRGPARRSFDRVLHEPLYGQPDCMSHLNSTKVPAVSENILLCAMHAQRMQLSIAQDRNPFRRGVHF